MEIEHGIQRRMAEGAGAVQLEIVILDTNAISDDRLLQDGRRV
ncbi:MAG: hypothetical protein ACREQM_07390 [Candidatus Dormibacteraceae bacterium]